MPEVPSEAPRVVGPPGRPWSGPRRTRRRTAGRSSSSARNTGGISASYGLRDSLFGRTKQVAPQLDNIFALPTAALTLQSELDLVTSGQAGLCFKAGSGESTITTDADIEELLNFDEVKDSFSLTTEYCLR